MQKCDCENKTTYKGNFLWGTVYPLKSYTSMEILAHILIRKSKETGFSKLSSRV